MAQSYDVYFARMLLTLGLVEREKLQTLLRTFQKIPGAKGFSRYLVEQKVLDAETVKKVGSDLETYLLQRRSKQRKAEAAAGGADAEVKKGKSSASHPALDVAEEEEEETPEATFSDSPSPSPSSAPLPPAATPLPPPPAPPPVLPPRSDAPKVGSGSSADRRSPLAAPSAKPGRESQRLKKPADSNPATPALAKEKESQRLKKPADSSVGASAHGKERESQRLKKPSDSNVGASAHGKERESQRLKKPSDSSVGASAHGKERESQRLKRSGTHSSEGAASPPGRESQRLKRSGTHSHETPAPASSAGSSAPASASAAAEQARQRALLDRATKDPLTKLVGRRLGRTDIIRLVETGPSVTIFEGKHGDDERPALIKVLRPDRVKDRSAIERFSREAKALEKIDHPNIARVFETGEAEKVRFLSIEASTGEVLSGLLERVGRLPPERIQKIGRATALGLAAAHRAGIVHRDVRPANIYIEEDGTVKISGFGLARDVEVPGRLTATGQITGHPSYVAPEIAAGEEVTGKADVYSLGIVLYLGLAGRLPFESRSVVKLVGMQMNTLPPPLQTVAPGTPPKLALAVEKFLAKSPAKRPDAMEAAGLLGAKDLLEGGSESSNAVSAATTKVVDAEEELRRMLAPDEEDSLSSEGPVPSPLGGPSCASCELPLGPRATSLHGNTICERCLERVEGLDVCAACFQELSGSEAGASDAAVFAGHCYCRSCTARVKLSCGQCGKPVGLVDLPSGRAKARGDQLVHATCPA